MDHELDLLLGTLVDSLTKLAILLHVYADPVAVFSPEALAAALGRRLEGVRSALPELAEAGLVKRFSVGTGRLAMYSAREDEHLQMLMAGLRERYAEGGSVGRRSRAE